MADTLQGGACTEELPGHVNRPGAWEKARPENRPCHIVGICYFHTVNYKVSLSHCLFCKLTNSAIQGLHIPLNESTLCSLHKYLMSTQNLKFQIQFLCLWICFHSWAQKLSYYENLLYKGSWIWLSNWTTCLLWWFGHVMTFKVTLFYLWIK